MTVIEWRRIFRKITFIYFYSRNRFYFPKYFVTRMLIFPRHLHDESNCSLFVCAPNWGIPMRVFTTLLLLKLADGHILRGARSWYVIGIAEFLCVSEFQNAIWDCWEHFALLSVHILYVTQKREFMDSRCNHRGWPQACVKETRNKNGLHNYLETPQTRQLFGWLAGCPLIKFKII